MESCSNFVEGTSGGHLIPPSPQSRKHHIILFPIKTVGKSGQEGGHDLTSRQPACLCILFSQFSAQNVNSFHGEPATSAKSLTDFTGSPDFPSS